MQSLCAKYTKYTLSVDNMNVVVDQRMEHIIMACDHATEYVLLMLYRQYWAVILSPLVSLILRTHVAGQLVLLIGE